MDAASIASLSHATSSVLEAALGALPIPAYTNDLDGFVTWQNTASRTVSGDLRGIHYSKVVPPHELARSRETWAAVTLGGATRRRTGFFRGADGELVQLEVITAPIRMDGEIVGTFGIAIPSASATGRT
jgi:PAS domain-containing protein